MHEFPYLFRGVSGQQARTPGAWSSPRANPLSGWCFYATEWR